MKRRRPTPGTDPFEILGLESSPNLSDEDVRIAWRRAASETHPDREDGGDPARFAAAAAAYTTLRTRFGRGEALADLDVGRRPPRSVPGRHPPGALGRLAARVRQGRPLRLALRFLAAAAGGVAAVLAAGPHPAAPALITGAATWLFLTARHDLAPPSDSADRGDRAESTGDL